MASPFVFDYALKLEMPSLVVVIPAGVVSAGDLFNEFNASFQFPYFGRNWDALEDCLRDISWVPEHTIAIIHCDIPSLPSDDLRNYIDVLASAASTWDSEPDVHKVLIIFPPRTRSAIAEILASHAC